MSAFHHQNRTREAVRRRLRSLKTAADDAYLALVEACRAAGYRDEFQFYRADDNAERRSSDHDRVVSAHDAAMAALHAFYGARDGERGFLGGRGA